MVKCREILPRYPFPVSYTHLGAKLEDIKIDQKNLQLFENAGIAVNTDQTGPTNISVNRSVLSRKGNTAV